MLTIIHGDDITLSRKLFIELRDACLSSTVLDGEKVTITELVQSLEGDELFSNERNIFIEQLLTRKKSSELDSLIKLIEKSEEANITLWDGKEVPKTILNSFSKANVRLFKLPQMLFNFLDSIKPGNGVDSIKLFHELQKTTPAEIVLFMLIRQFRILLNVNIGENCIEEVLKIADWQKNKLIKQRGQFTDDALVNLYTRLFKLDKAAKTGGLQQPISDSIDIFLLEI